MGLKEIQDCERTKIEKLSGFQLPNRWKTIGALLSLTVFITMLSLKFIDTPPLWVKELLKRSLLVGLLIVILAKEKDEDEMIASLRGKAYTLAFIFGVVYALVQPLIDTVVHGLLYEAGEDNGFSYFQLLFFMLFIQILFFEVLKRNR
ncbi:hypothetical protein Q2T40_12510 [Winogradskyella maritima]|uniref:Uncharacterized protein n=1 Tax=Winogradskyella maritima TaxID=1517766 RepID=A0ABV8AH78_9FLAO|nr:hypothetical protein [Winogradskyella maritima]